MGGLFSNKQRNGTQPSDTRQKPLTENREPATDNYSSSQNDFGMLIEVLVELVPAVFKWVIKCLVDSQ